MQLSTLAERLDNRLDTDAYADVDASPNGLQVGPEEMAVEHVAFAVDAAAATIDAAADAGADALLTHHGLVWGGLDRVTGRDYGNIAALVENDLALYVSHLPLDGHETLGNAAGLADHLDLDADSREPFGALGPVTIGQRGRASEAYSVPELRERLSDLDTDEREPHVLDFGPEEIRDVAIVTGSGVDWLGEAADAGVDALVTGEGKQQVYHEAREAGVNVFLAGHYATETFGVENLAGLVSEWGLQTTVLSHPTGL
ncbi:Nif3-like dinuclear metal center hexameric protein [Halobellus captivus]|uniref:Nif3-like dinuclear metal center hexameric protein n=1 Tax=Halobellus captivus TaxID=2592614 RepID=UPI0011A9E895|nr:Nif3-like dinuclear metal center hexameric protein [Halobellus captivus]